MAEQTLQREDVRGSGIYPATGPHPPSGAVVRTPAALAHPEDRRSWRPDQQALQTTALLAGRAIFGGYFLYNALNHFTNHQMMTEYARSKGVPAPGAAVAGSGLLILTGGLSILTGAWPKIGAGLISTFLLGVSPMMHAFWKEEDAQQQMQEMVNFTKNMALVGASLLAAAHPEPWPVSVPTQRSGALALRM